MWFACAEVFLDGSRGSFKWPSDDTILVTDRVRDVEAFIGASRYLVLDEDTLEGEINTPLLLAGRPCLSENRAEFVVELAAAVGVAPGEDLRFLGSAGLDFSGIPEPVSSMTAVHWMANALNVIAMARPDAR